MWSRWSRSGVNAYGQPDRKISAFFFTTPLRITVLTVMGWKSWGEWVWIVWRGRCGLFSVLHFSRQPTSALRDVDSATPTLNSSDFPIRFWARVILQCIELKEHDIRYTIGQSKKGLSCPFCPRPPKWRKNMTFAIKGGCWVGGHNFLHFLGHFLWERFPKKYNLRWR